MHDLNVSKAHKIDEDARASISQLVLIHMRLEICLILRDMYRESADQLTKAAKR